MNERIYKDRVRTTPAMLITLSALLKKDDDFQKKKKHPTKFYRDAVAKQLKLSEENNPSLRSYEEEVKKLRIKFKKPDPLDNPWSIATLPAFPISPDALPSVLKAWIYMNGNFNDDLTVRCALWVSRLYAVLPDIAGLVGGAKNYAQFERIHEIVEARWPEEHWNYDSKELIIDLYEKMTKEKLKPELKEKILADKEKRKSLKQTPEESLAVMKQLTIRLEAANILKEEGENK